MLYGELDNTINHTYYNAVLEVNHRVNHCGQRLSKRIAVALSAPCSLPSCDCVYFYTFWLNSGVDRVYEEMEKVSFAASPFTPFKSVCSSSPRAFTITQQMGLKPSYSTKLRNWI